MNAPGAHVAVGAGERAAVEVAGAARQRERAVDDARRRLVDERLGRLGLGEQRGDLLVGAVAVGSRRGARRSARPRARAWRGSAESSIAFSADEHRARAHRRCSRRATSRRGPRAAASAMPSEAEAWKSPAARLRSMYARGVAGGEAAAQRAAGQLDAVEGDRVAARGAHAERVPVVVDATPGASGGDLRVAVALDAVVVGEGDATSAAWSRRATSCRTSCGRRSRQPASVRVALGGRPGEVLPGSLIAAAITMPSRAICSQRRREGRARGARRRPRRRHAPAAGDVEHDDEVHVHADRDRGVAAGQPARGDDQVVDRLDAEAAELARAPARRSSPRAAARRCSRTGSCRRGRARPPGRRSPRRAARRVATSAPPASVLAVSSIDMAADLRVHVDRRRRWRRCRRRPSAPCAPLDDLAQLLRAARRP